MNTYIIDFENAEWCGGGAYVIVKNCINESHAEAKAAEYMKDYQRELYSDHESESENEDDSSAVSINSTELLDASHPD